MYQTQNGQDPKPQLYPEAKAGNLKHVSRSRDPWRDSGPERARPRHIPAVSEREPNCDMCVFPNRGC